MPGATGLWSSGWWRLEAAAGTNCLLHLKCGVLEAEEGTGIPTCSLWRDVQLETGSGEHPAQGEASGTGSHSAHPR